MKRKHTVWLAVFVLFACEVDGVRRPGKRDGLSPSPDIPIIDSPIGDRDPTGAGGSLGTGGTADGSGGNSAASGGAFPGSGGSSVASGGAPVELGGAAGAPFGGMGGDTPFGDSVFSL